MLPVSGCEGCALDLTDDNVFLLLLEEAASSAIGAESAGAVVGTFFFCLELLNFRLVSLLISCQISMTHKRYLSSALR